METASSSKPIPPPASTANGEAAALQTQLHDHATKQTDEVAEAIKEGEGKKDPKKPADAGMKNYFVSVITSIYLLTDHHR